MPPQSDIFPLKPQSAFPYILCAPDYRVPRLPAPNYPQMPSLAHFEGNSRSSSDHPSLLQVPLHYFSRFLYTHHLIHLENHGKFSFLSPEILEVKLHMVSVYFQKGADHSSCQAYSCPSASAVLPSSSSRSDTSLHQTHDTNWRLHRRTSLHFFFYP